MKKALGPTGEMSEAANHNGACAVHIQSSAYKFHSRKYADYLAVFSLEPNPACSGLPAETMLRDHSWK